MTGEARIIPLDVRIVARLTVALELIGRGPGVLNALGPEARRELSSHAGQYAEDVTEETTTLVGTSENLWGARTFMFEWMPSLQSEVAFVGGEADGLTISVPRDSGGFPPATYRLPRSRHPTVDWHSQAEPTAPLEPIAWE